MVQPLFLLQRNDMYTIIGALDRYSQERVRSIWRSLSVNSLSNYTYEVVDREPHLTFSSLEKVDLADIQLISEEMAKISQL
ncbi:hypothetical protein HMPREF9682_01422 [Streptococcus intermedius F0395]|nr:hypothetical protein HMPREF9682_01422 [Streptococcus intermedius F0395]